MLAVYILLLHQASNQRRQTEFRWRFAGEFSHERAHPLTAAARLSEDKRDAAVLLASAAVPRVVRYGCEVKALFDRQLRAGLSQQ